MMSSPDSTRYARQIRLPEVGLEGQAVLAETSVLLVGAGGLGSPMALYLAAAGVGRIGLIDFDAVELTNLQRQVLYGTSDVGRTKLEAAHERLRDLNPNVRYDLHPTRLTRENALDLLEPYDIVADGTDNFATRYLVNDACVMLGKPNVYGSIFRFEGQASVFGAPGGPCYRCLYDRPPPPELAPSCAEGGVLGVLPGLIGAIQATEVLKLALGIGETLAGRLLRVDTRSMQFHSVAVSRDPDCPLCGDHPTITELVDYEAFCGTSAAPDGLPEITPQEFDALMTSGERPFVLDVRTEDEYAESNLGGVLIPLHELADRLGELEAARSAERLVVHCRSGARSARAMRILRDAGFVNAENLRGGILAWQALVGDSAPDPA